MKRLLGALGALSVLITCCAADTSEIWGLWNLGPKSEATLGVETPLGKFLRAGNFLEIGPNGAGEKVISYEGGYYVIKSTEKTPDGFLLTLAYGTDVKTPTGHWERKVVGGVVAMHFLARDQVWFEVVTGNATDPLFPHGPQSDFPGKSKEYWRAEKVGQ